MLLFCYDLVLANIIIYHREVIRTMHSYVPRGSSSAETLLYIFYPL